tara:strand:- start:2554 stop:2931 length:378 start_codon:yes stop_codon:yes gene_type:complete
MKTNVTAGRRALKHMLKVLIMLPAIAIAHTAHDPVKDINKNDQVIIDRQSDFEQTQSVDQKVKNVQEQISAMERKMLTLRNMMASDYPHIKEKMSKYTFDYMESVDDTLVQLKKTLKQTSTIVEQ